MYSKEGVEMMAIDQLDVAEGKIVIKGKMMSSMGTTIHVEAVGLVQLVKLLSPLKVLKIIGLLIKGLFRASGPNDMGEEAASDITLPLPPRRKRN